MEKHGTTSQPVAGWYVEFQMAVLRALPRDINQEVADKWRGNGEALAKNLREVLIPIDEDSIYLKLISRGLVLDAVDGTEILSRAKDTFAYIDSDFISWSANEEGPATKEVSIAVYEIVKDATFLQMFDSLSNDPNSLCLTQAQIKKFVRKYRNWFRTDGYATFFLFKSHSQFFVAGVGFGSDGGLEVGVRRLGYSRVWGAGFRHRLVVPQLAQLV